MPWIPRRDPALRYWAEVAEANVGARQVEAARQAIAYVEADLELQPIRLRWFRAAAPGARILAFSSHGAILGLATRGTRDVWVRTGLGPGATVRVVLHEARHRRDWQDCGEIAVQHDRAGWEATAATYAFRHEAAARQP